MVSRSLTLLTPRECCGAAALMAASACNSPSLLWGRSLIPNGRPTAVSFHLLSSWGIKRRSTWLAGTEALRCCCYQAISSQWIRPGPLTANPLRTGEWRSSQHRASEQRLGFWIWRPRNPRRYISDGMRQVWLYAFESEHWLRLPLPNLPKSAYV